MHTYEFTDSGVETAERAELANLTNKLIEREVLGDVTEHFLNDGRQALDYESRANEKIQVTLNSFYKSPDYQRQFQKAFFLDPEVSGWHYLTGKSDSDNKLFEIPVIKRFADVGEKESYVLSGAVGLEYNRFKPVKKLLSEAGLTEFGFDNRLNAAAFVGAFVIRAINLEMESSYLSRRPSFSFKSEGIVNTIAVGGDMHGDFILTHKQHVANTAISPLNQHVQFSPEIKTSVTGYHSVEPDITASMIEAEFIRTGKEGALKLLWELTDVATTFADKNKNYKPGFSLFGDYGTRGLDYTLSELSILVKGHKMNNTLLTSSPSAPQSSIHFEIVTNKDGGIGLRNRNFKTDKTFAEVNIPRAHYGSLFNTLLYKAIEGLGRTAPDQHWQILKSAAKILQDEEKDSDYAD